jgi:hypothetical protein
MKETAMALTFYPHTEDTEKGTLQERIDIIADAAERYKAVVLDNAAKQLEADSVITKITIPRDQTVAFNWEAIARILREVRDMPEISKLDKTNKADMLNKLAEIYEVLRAAKMPKLEAVRLALMNEVNHLRGVL